MGEVDNKPIYDQIAFLFQSLSAQVTSENLGEWLVKWYETYKVPKLKDSSLRNLREYIRRDILSDPIAQLPLIRLTGEDIQKFLIAIPYSNSRKKIGMLLNAALTKALKLRKIAYNPYDGVELPTHRPKHYRALEYAEQRLILENENNEIYKSVFWVMCCCGFRVGELAAIDFIKDVDLYEKVIHVGKSIDAVTKKTVLPKTEKSIRDVPFLSDLVPHIERLKAYQQSGGAITYDGMHMHFSRLYRRLGIDGANIHSMRHTFISLCYAAGMRDKLIQQFAGHATIDVTLDVYTHILKKGGSPLSEYMIKLKKETDLTQTGKP